MKLRIVVIFTLFILSNCESDFLEENPKSFLGPSNALVNVQGFESAITGLHHIARDEWGFIYGGFTYGTFFSGTDVALNAQAHGEYQNFELYGSSVNSGNGSAWGMYNWAYTLIGNANQIITSAENPDIVWTDEITKSGVIAEARFFRAYAYRTLVNLFGDVPIVQEVVKPFRTDYQRDPVSSVVAFTIEDLQFASENLPEAAPMEGRIPKAAAQHYLGEMLIFNGQSDLAVSALTEIINSGQYQLMQDRFGNHLGEPGDVFSDLFKENNQNQSSGNLETIWAMQFQFNVPGGDTHEWSRRGWVSAYYQNPGMIISEEYGGRGVGRLRPIAWVMESYEDGDIRNSEYNVQRTFIANDPNSPMFGSFVDVTEETRESGFLYETFKKFYFFKEESPFGAFSQKERYRVRLAETYLLLAEAYINLSEFGLAADNINAVRERANATPLSSTEVDMDALLDERARELFGEYPRRYTLIRTGTLLDRVQRLNPVSSATIEPHNVLWPIPQQVIDSNTTADFPQNPGY